MDGRFLVGDRVRMESINDFGQSISVDGTIMAPTYKGDIWVPIKIDGDKAASLVAIEALRKIHPDSEEFQKKDDDAVQHFNVGDRVVIRDSFGVYKETHGVVTDNESKDYIWVLIDGYKVSNVIPARFLTREEDGDNYDKLVRVLARYRNAKGEMLEAEQEVKAVLTEGWGFRYD